MQLQDDRMRASSPVGAPYRCAHPHTQQYTIIHFGGAHAPTQGGCKVVQWVLRLATDVMEGTSSLAAETCKQHQEASVGGTTRELWFAMLTSQRRRRCAMWCGQENGWDGQILELDIVYVDGQLAFQLYETNPKKGWAHPDEIYMCTQMKSRVKGGASALMPWRVGRLVRDCVTF